LYSGLRLISGLKWARLSTFTVDDNDLELVNFNDDTTVIPV
jgi:hypothetical protein